MIENRYNEVRAIGNKFGVQDVRVIDREPTDVEQKGQPDRFVVTVAALFAGVSAPVSVTPADGQTRVLTASTKI